MESAASPHRRLALALTLGATPGNLLVVQGINQERRFQTDWRAVARAAGTPDYVLNRDGRAGDVTAGSYACAAVIILRGQIAHKGELYLGQHPALAGCGKIQC